MTNDEPFRVKNGLTAKHFPATYTTLSGTAIDVTSADYFKKEIDSNTTFTFTNPPTSGELASFALEVTSVNGYNLSNASYDSVSFSVSSQDSDPQGLQFSGNGLRMYIVGSSSDTVYEYGLTSAFDVSTASLITSLNISSQAGYPRGLFISSSGTNMFVVGQATDRIYHYTLSTGFDLSTASYNTSLLVSSVVSIPFEVSFNPEGTRMFIINTSNDRIYQYSLSTGFDLSTASYDNINLDVSTEDSSPDSLCFNESGTKMFLVGQTSNNVFQYSLSTPFDLSTASYDSISFDLTTQDTGPQAITFNADGTKMYIAGVTNDTIYQYSTEAASTPTITWPTGIRWAGGSAPNSPAAGQTDQYVFFTYDGGTTYWGKQSGGNIS